MVPPDVNDGVDSVSVNGKNVPKALHVRKSPVKDLNGTFYLQVALCNGHPLWKKKHDNKFIRFFNSTEDCNGGWMITSDLKDDDVCWCWTEESVNHPGECNGRWIFNTTRGTKKMRIVCTPKS